jgi:O-antigen/teichoic acid export membrane protein
MPRGFPQRLLTRQNFKVSGAVGAFFSLKFAFGLGLIGISSARLTIPGFVTFSQFFLFFALLSTIAAAGVQNGLARQIAFAKGDPGAEHRAVAAAFRIWAGASLAIILLATLFRSNLSELLVGDASLASVVPYLTLAGAGGGFGILACSILAGRQRAPTSLILQSTGLVVGGLLCVWWLLAGDPVGAVLGYAAGPLVTSVLAAIVIHRLGIRFGRAEGQWPEMRLLFGYSLAFLAIAIIMPATLFALRVVYREAFGTDLLAYWLAANRASDVTSQILGLYMAQIFLPQAAQAIDPQRVRRLLLGTLAVGSVIMLGGWAVFSLGAPFFVTTFFSAAYLPAIPFIAGYLLGDGLRVTASMAIHLMLARRRLLAAVGVELGTASLLATYLLVFAGLGWSEAPYWAYPAAYATMALVLLPVICRSTFSTIGILAEQNK